MEEWINRAWGAALVAGPVFAGAWAWVSSQRRAMRQELAESRKADVELRGAEAKVTDEEERAAQKRKQEQSDWAVKQAMALYEEMRKQVAMALYKVERAIRRESRCRVIVATIYAQLRELQRKAKIDRNDPEFDRWVDEVLNPPEDRGERGDPEADSDDDPTHAGA